MALSGISIFLLVLFSWILLIIYLSPQIKNSKHFALLGPALMLRATRNRGILDRFSKKFPGISFAKFSVALVLLTSAFAMIFLAYGAYLSTTVRVTSAPDLRLLIGLPGINPAIPVTYGTAALIISVVIHEFMHGIIARKHDIKVKSVGILFFIIPIGAFVEPDEEEVTKADPVVRRRIFAGGPSINIVLGIVMVLLLTFVLMPVSHPLHDGVYIQSVDAKTIFSGKISPGTEMVSFGTYSGSQVNYLYMNSSIIPGALTNATFFNGKAMNTVKIPAGLTLDSLLPGFPMSKTNASIGSIFYSIDNKTIYNVITMNNILDNITPGSAITITMLSFSNDSNSPAVNTYNITTASKYDYYQQYAPTSNQEIYKSQSFIGVTTSYIGVTWIPIEDLYNEIFVKNMFTNPWYGMLEAIALPFVGLSPISPAMASLFASPFSPTLYWGMVNSIYWLFWINFLLGVTNALPFFILDGGQFFRDSIFILGRRKRLRFLQKESVIRNIAAIFNVLVFVLIMWQIIIPRII